MPLSTIFQPGNYVTMLLSGFTYRENQYICKKKDEIKRQQNGNKINVTLLRSYGKLINIAPGSNSIYRSYLEVNFHHMQK